MDISRYYRHFLGCSYNGIPINLYFQINTFFLFNGNRDHTMKRLILSSMQAIYVVPDEMRANVTEMQEFVTIL